MCRSTTLLGNGGRKHNLRCLQIAEEAVEILQWCAEKFSNVNQARPRSARRALALTLKMQDTILYLANATRVVADAVGHYHNQIDGTNVPDVLMKLIPLLVTRIHKHCFSRNCCCIII